MGSLHLLFWIVLQNCPLVGKSYSLQLVRFFQPQTISERYFFSNSTSSENTNKRFCCLGVTKMTCLRFNPEHYFKIRHTISHHNVLFHTTRSLTSILNRYTDSLISYNGPLSVLVQQSLFYQWYTLAWVLTANWKHLSRH